MPSDEGSKERVKQNWRKAPLPREIHLPEDFEGVVQINVQSQKETETESITQAQAQTQSTSVAVAQMQAQMQAVTTQLQQLQNLMQLMFMAILAAPGGADAGERQQLLREIVTMLRANPQ